MHTILGLDTSSTTIGYCLWDGSQALAHGTLAFPARCALLARMGLAETALRALLARYAPDVLAREGAVKSYMSSLIAQQQMIGVVRLTALRYGVLELEVQPTEGKKALFGHGKASKQQMCEAAIPYFAAGQSVVVTQRTCAKDAPWCVRALDGAVLYDEHAADALGVGMAAHSQVKVEQVAA